MVISFFYIRQFTYFYVILLSYKYEHTYNIIITCRRYLRKNMLKKSYLKEVLDQPKFLRLALKNYPIQEIGSLYKRLQAGEFTKIIFTGHGSSLNSLYPAFLRLSTQSLPITLWQTAELLHYGSHQIDSGTLLCINSQSGQSAEAKNLIGQLKNDRPACLISLTNNENSVLATNSDIVLEFKCWR